jgi:hypothetical protein
VGTVSSLQRRDSQLEVGCLLIEIHAEKQMILSRVDMLRDGGTIILTVVDDAKAGKYVLPTPFVSEPRRLSWNGKEIPIGSLEETEFLAKLKNWLNDHAAEKLVDSLQELNRLKKRPLPDHVEKAFAFHRVQIVADYLEHRPTASKSP